MNIWEEEKEVLNLSDLAGPIAEAIITAIKLGPDAIKTGILWNGPKFQSKMLRAVVLQPEVQLQSKQLEYHIELGRNLIDIIAMIAIQLGIEQGMKIYEEEYLEPLMIARCAESAKKMEKEIKEELKITEQTDFEKQADANIQEMRNILDEFKIQTNKIIEVVTKNEV